MNSVIEKMTCLSLRKGGLEYSGKQQVHWGGEQVVPKEVLEITHGTGRREMSLKGTGAASLSQ